MLLPIKAICDRRSKRDGTHAINIQYYYSADKRTVLPTGIFIPIRYWNRKQQAVGEKMPPMLGNAEDLNNAILQLVRRAEDMVCLAKKRQMYPIQFLKDHFLSSVSLEELEEQLKKQEATALASANNLDFFTR